MRRAQTKNTFWAYLIAAFCGELIYYACGLIYYYIFFNYVITDGGVIGVNELLVVWCFSTFLPDFGLAVLAAFLSKRLAPHMPPSMRAVAQQTEPAIPAAEIMDKETAGVDAAAKTGAEVTATQVQENGADQIPAAAPEGLENTTAPESERG